MLLSEAKQLLKKNGFRLVEDTDDWDEADMPAGMTAKQRKAMVDIHNGVGDDKRELSNKVKLAKFRNDNERDFENIEEILSGCDFDFVNDMKLMDEIDSLEPVYAAFNIQAKDEYNDPIGEVEVESKMGNITITATAYDKVNKEIFTQKITGFDPEDDELISKVSKTVDKAMREVYKAWDKNSIAKRRRAFERGEFY